MKSVSEKAFLQKILHGFVEVSEDETGALRLYRVPRSLLPNLGVRVNMRCYHPAGGELRFRMKDTPVRFKIRRITEPDHPLFIHQTVFPVGVFHGDFQYTWLALLEGDNEFKIRPFPDRTGLMHRTQRRFNPELTRIVLPPFIDLRIVDWEGEMEPPRPGDCPEKQLLSYGSSITQGAYGQLGNETYPAVIARELGVDVCNLGFGGGATMEPAIAEWIVSRTDWTLATLEMGVNVFNRPPEAFRELVRKFLAVFADDPLKRPVFSLDMLPFGEEFGDDREVRAKAAAYRRIVREETAAAGKPWMDTLEYASLIRASDFSTDLLHPAAHAFQAIGHGLAEQIKSKNLSVLN